MLDWLVSYKLCPGVPGPGLSEYLPTAAEDAVATPLAISWSIRASCLEMIVVVGSRAVRHHAIRSGISLDDG